MINGYFIILLIYSFLYLSVQILILLITFLLKFFEKAANLFEFKNRAIMLKKLLKTQQKITFEFTENFTSSSLIKIRVLD